MCTHQINILSNVYRSIQILRDKKGVGEIQKRGRRLEWVEEKKERRGKREQSGTIFSVFAFYHVLG